VIIEPSPHQGASSSSSDSDSDSIVDEAGNGERRFSMCVGQDDGGRRRAVAVKGGGGFVDLDLDLDLGKPRLIFEDAWGPIPFKVFDMSTVCRVRRKVGRDCLGGGFGDDFFFTRGSLFGGGAAWIKGDSDSNSDSGRETSIGWEGGDWEEGGFKELLGICAWGRVHFPVRSTLGYRKRKSVIFDSTLREL